MVLDSKLPEHLAHFGIDMMTMEKARPVIPHISCHFSLLKKTAPLILNQFSFASADRANDDGAGDCC